MVLELVRDVVAGVRGAVRGLALRIVEDIGRRGDTAALSRRVADLNARLAALEPRGEAVGLCGVCGGALHVVVRGVVVPVDDVTVERDIWRCARCWALRPVYRSGGERPGPVSS